MIKHKLSLILCLMLILLTGCWDSINIEDRGFIVGTAIDLEKMKEDTPVYSVTDQLVLPESFGGASQGGSTEEAYLNLTTTGSSIYRINEDLPAISSKSPYYEHLKIIVISEEVATTDHLINQLLDRYIRDVSLRRGIKVIVAENQAHRLLEVNNPESKLPSIHINQMLQRSSENAGFLSPLTLGDIEEIHLRGRSYVLPIMSVDDDKIKRKSGAVFQGAKGKMVGSLQEKNMQGLELYKGEATGNIIEFTYQDKTFAFKINQIQNKQKIDSSKAPLINVHAQIILNGTIKEATINEEFVNAKELQSIQEAISKEAKKTVEATIQQAQDEYHADIFNVWQKLQTKDYNTWKKVRDDWESGENYFANNVTFDIEVKTEIYSVGTSKQTK